MSRLLVTSVDGPAVALRLTELAGRIDGREAAVTLGELLRRRLLARTARGEDADGQPFAPYAAAYARHRRRHGRDSRIVTLRYTGEMLDSLTLQPAPGGIDLVFGSGAAAARAAHHQRTRRFMGANDADLAALRAALETFLLTD